MYRILHLSLLLFFITSPLKSATFKIEKFTFQESNNLQWEIYREKSNKLSLSEVKNTPPQNGQQNPTMKYLSLVETREQFGYVPIL